MNIQSASIVVSEGNEEHVIGHWKKDLIKNGKNIWLNFVSIVMNIIIIQWIFLLLYYYYHHYYGQKSLVGWSPWGHKDLDITQVLSTQHDSLLIIIIQRWTWILS